MSKPGDLLNFAHGYNIAFGLIDPPPESRDFLQHAAPTLGFVSPVAFERQHEEKQAA
jgi:hypothetical protein